MSEQEFKKSPRFDMKSIPLGKSVKFKLKGANSASSGVGRYGNWYMWVGEVTDQPVFEGRGSETKQIEKYTGEVIFFPTEKLHEKLKETANGKTGVEVKIIKEAFENEAGTVRKVYKVEKLSEGAVPQSSLTPGEKKLLEDFETLTVDGYVPTETDFINASKDEKYGGQISEERAKVIFSYFKQ